MVSGPSRLACALVAAGLAGCTTAPEGGFAGHWRGVGADGTFFTTSTTQHDSAFAGTGTLTLNGTTATGGLYGISARPNVEFTFDNSFYRFTGVYVTADSVAGELAYDNGLFVSISFKRL